MFAFRSELHALVSQKLTPPAPSTRGDLTVSLLAVTCPLLFPRSFVVDVVLFYFLAKVSSAGYIPAGILAWPVSSRARKTNICEQVFSLRAVKYPLSSQDSSWLGFDKQAFELKTHQVVQTLAISP